MAALLCPGPAHNLFSTIVCFVLLISLGLVQRLPPVFAADPTMATAPPMMAPTSVPAPAPAPKVLTLHEKVVSSLRAAGHYGALSGLLDSIPDTIIKNGTTLFAPDDTAFQGVPMNNTGDLQNMMNYHVATKDYSFQALMSLPVGSKLQTAAQGITITVTSVAKNGYKVDNSLVADPDLYTDGSISVHGINAVMDTASYNKGLVAPEAAPAVTVSPPAPSVPAPQATPSGTTTPTKNDAANVKTTAVITSLLISAVSLLLASPSL